MKELNGITLRQGLDFYVAVLLLIFLIYGFFDAYENSAYFSSVKNFLVYSFGLFFFGYLLNLVNKSKYILIFKDEYFLMVFLRKIIRVDYASIEKISPIKNKVFIFRITSGKKILIDARMYSNPGRDVFCEKLKLLQ